MFKSKILPRVFILAVMVMIAADACPAPSCSLVIKKPVAQFLDLVGLRQGSWAMFTPNPVLNNRWFSAEMTTKDGKVTNWDSPLWSRATVWDKFVQFRHVNYYNRIYQPWCWRGANDYMQYRARQAGEELESIQLHQNHLDLVMPEDGTLPPRDEAEWRLITEPWVGNKVIP